MHHIQALAGGGGPGARTPRPQPERLEVRLNPRTFFVVRSGDNNSREQEDYKVDGLTNKQTGINHVPNCL